LEKAGIGIFNYNLSNNLIRFNDVNNKFSGIPEYNFNDISHYVNNILNQSPDFKNEFVKINKIWVGNNSAGKGKAVWNNGTELIQTDILGRPRPNPADLGAYNSVIFE